MRYINFGRQTQLNISYAPQVARIVDFVKLQSAETFLKAKINKSGFLFLWVANENQHFLKFRSNGYQMLG